MGIWQYQKQKGRFVGYLYRNGLATREYIWGAAMKTTDGTVCFGFSNVSYFSTVFRKQFGIPPTEFIEQKLAEDTG